MELLPPFTSEGVLPEGDYQLTLSQLKTSHLVTGVYSSHAVWNSSFRLELVENAEILIKQLWKVGIQMIFLNGSFVEDKSLPGDIDGYFECDMEYFMNRQFHSDINAIDPFQVWDWSRRFPGPNSTKPQLPMWHRYKVEFYAHIPMFTSGIPDEFGNDQTFPAAFRKSRRQHLSKGIVQIIQDEAQED